MDERYCIAMMNVPRKKERHTLPLFLSGEDKPVVYDSIGEAVETAKGLKQLNPKINFEIFPFYRPCQYAFEIMQYGTWMIGKESLAKI